MAVKRSLAAVTAPLAAMAIAAPAHADENDYVSELVGNYIDYDSVGQLINVGWQICSFGRTVPKDILIPVEAAITPYLAITKGAGFSEGESHIIVNAAANLLCPDVDFNFGYG